jgi:viroplasmin and RNaseH domain-containing protein
METVLKWYAIRVGRKNKVIVTSWEECEPLVIGYPRAQYKSFNTHQKAKDYLRGWRKTDPAVWDRKKYPCVERKTYTDTLTGIRYKNRCVRRKGPTMRGKRYKPHIGNSIPWKTP